MGAAFDEHDARRLGADVPEVLPQRLARDLGERAGQLDAGRSAADDHERQQAPLHGGVRLPLRRFERQQHPPPDLERIVERLQPGRARRPLGVAEVRMRRAGRDDQVVVRHLVAARPALEDHATGRDVDGLHVGQQDTHVLLMAQHPADRRRDVAGRQRGRGHLIQQRLEQVVVVAVESVTRTGAPASARAACETAEAAADDHHVRASVK